MYRNFDRIQKVYPEDIDLRWALDEVSPKGIVETPKSGRWERKRKIMKYAFAVAALVSTVRERYTSDQAEGRADAAATCLTRVSGRTELGDRDFNCLRGGHVGESVIVRLETKEDLRSYRNELADRPLIDIGGIAVWTLYIGAGTAAVGFAYDYGRQFFERRPESTEGS